jgi:hypothetical protein
VCCFHRHQVRVYVDRQVMLQAPFCSHLCDAQSHSPFIPPVCRSQAVRTSKPSSEAAHENAQRHRQLSVKHPN